MKLKSTALLLGLLFVSLVFADAFRQTPAHSAFDNGSAMAEQIFKQNVAEHSSVAAKVACREVASFFSTLEDPDFEADYRNGFRTFYLKACISGSKA